MPRRPSRKRVNKRVRKKGSLGSLLREADARARTRSREIRNRRSYRRSERTVQHAIAETAPEPIETLPGFQRLLRWVIALCLLPLCFVTSVTLFQRVANPAVMAPFWRSAEFWYFCTGLILMAGWFFSRVFQGFFLYLYVLGHELTHAIFVYASFGRVADIKVTKQGGYIITNKSNVLIALSPYFVPFWTTVVLLIALPLDHWVPGIPHFEKVLFLLVGATWGFHLFWTIWMIPRDQPDLKENDTLFSLVVIYLVNVIVVSGLVCLATDRVTWREFLYSWANNTQEVVDFVQAFVVGG